MKGDFSEFTYGYALVSELRDRKILNLNVTPIYPSLHREARLGYDAKIKTKHGAFFYLQFKLSEVMIGKNSSLYIDGSYRSLPYYRFHIYHSRRNSQHHLLLKRENKGKYGKNTYYVSPSFHTVPGLNDAYRKNQVTGRSIWVRPSFIGFISDSQSHYVAFQRSGNVFKHSETKRIEGDVSFEAFSKNISDIVDKHGDYALTEDGLKDTERDLTDLLLEDKSIPKDLYESVAKEVVELGLIERIAYYSYVFFDTMTLIASKEPI